MGEGGRGEGRASMHLCEGHEGENAAEDRVRMKTLSVAKCSIYTLSMLSD
jgi:hypothetical protein